MADTLATIFPADRSDLPELGEIAEQTSFRVNERSRNERNRGGMFGWNVSPSLARASVAREKKKTSKKKTRPRKKAPKPIASKSPPSAGRPAAVAQVFTSYSTLIETCRVRCDQLELSRAELDRLSGLPDGYSSKLLGRDGCGQRQKRVWPVSLDAMLGALGLQVILIENEAALARTLARREKPVNRSQQRFGNVSRISAVPALPPPESKEATAA
jgi:hypothetical protein